MTQSPSINFSDLSWLKNYRVADCPDNVIKVQFRRPKSISEDILVRIDTAENRTVHYVVISQPENDRRIDIRNLVIAENYYFEHADRVAGYPDNVFKVHCRRSAIISEEVLVRIDSVEDHTFHCTVVCQPQKDWRIKMGDQILVEYYYFEQENRLFCPTIEEKFDFHWL
jgi:hypothetical protein